MDDGHIAERRMVQVLDHGFVHEERALRGWIRGEHKEPMTAEQREWCLGQIERVEGYKRTDYEASADADLAHAVLDAWTDFCRDKGLLP